MKGYSRRRQSFPEFRNLGNSMTLQTGERFFHLLSFARTDGPAAGEPDLMLQPRMLDRYDELLMAVAERTGLFAEKRKKFLLQKTPAIICTLLQGHRPHLRYFVGLALYKTPRMTDSLQLRTPSISAFFRRKAGARLILKEAQMSLH